MKTDWQQIIETMNSGHDSCHSASYQSATDQDCTGFAFLHKMRNILINP
jgi:hypothetical protein